MGALRQHNERDDLLEHLGRWVTSASGCGAAPIVWSDVTVVFAAGQRVVPESGHCVSNGRNIRDSWSGRRNLRGR